MRGVAFAFEPLQIVAVLDRFRDIKMILRECHPFIIWQKRHLFFGAHVSEHAARGLFAGIGGMTNLVLERAAGRLCRSFENSAVNVVFPAMIDAGQPAASLRP